MDDEDIEYIDKNTRRRNGKLEHKDSVTGVWVMHSIEFFKEFNMEETMREWDEENERARKELFDPTKAEDYIRTQVGEEWEEAKEVTVKKVLAVSMPIHFKEDRTEIIFDGILKKKENRFIAGCFYYAGDFYEPPSGECWFDDFKETMQHLEESVVKFTTPKDRFLDPEKTRRGLVADAAFSPIKTKEQYEHEKNRLEWIYHDKIERLNYLKKFKNGG